MAFANEKAPPINEALSDGGREEAIMVSSALQYKIQSLSHV